MPNSFWSRFMGSNEDPEMDQRIQESRKRLQPEIVKAGYPTDVPIQNSQASLLGRIFGSPSGQMATYNPLTSSISVNPAALKDRSPQELDQTLWHEMTHANQWKNRGLMDKAKLIPEGFLNGLDMMLGTKFSTPYYDRPDELGAYQAEKDRDLRLGLGLPDPTTGNRDIYLPNYKKRPITQAYAFGRKQ